MRKKRLQKKMDKFLEKIWIIFAKLPEYWDIVVVYLNNLDSTERLLFYSLLAVVFFYQFVFQHQGVKFGGGQNIINIADFSDQETGLDVMLRSKIRSHPFVERFSLTDINNRSESVFKKIDPRLVGDSFKFAA